MTNELANKRMSRRITKEMSMLDKKIIKACCKLNIPVRDYIINRDNIQI